MKQKEFKKDFNLRLYRLAKALDEYRINKSTSDLFPSLFSVFSYLWISSNPYKSR